MPEKKKVILVGPAYPYRGGLASFNERLVREFIAQGYETEMLTFSLQYPDFLFPGKTQYSSSPAPAGLTIERVVNSVNPFNWFKVGRRIAKEAPDLVLVRFWLPFMGPSMGTIARIARSNKKTKVIAIIDNMIPHEKRIGDRLFSNYFVKSIDGFIVMSQSVLKDVLSFDNKKPKGFNPHPLFDNFGVSVSKTVACRELGLEEACKYILFFGFVRDYKGLDLLLKAFADERFRDKNVKLIIAGEYYNDKEKYQRIIKENKLEADIIQKNEFIPDEAVKYYFGACDIVAQPYKTATQSGVTQIGYHFEKPMLVTNVGGLPEIVPHNKIGYVVAPDKQAIANALFQYLEEDRMAEFVENLKVEKKRFSWGKMIETIETVHQELIISK